MTATTARGARRGLRLGTRKWPDLTDEERVGVLDWIVDLCLMHGSTKQTAYRVAAEFAQGMDPNPRWR